MIDREQFEDHIPEPEWHHRFEHAILKPLDLYWMWKEEEIEKLKKNVISKFKGHTATLLLVKMDHFKPPLYMYRLVSFEKNKK